METRTAYKAAIEIAFRREIVIASANVTEMRIKIDIVKVTATRIVINTDTANVKTTKIRN